MKKLLSALACCIASHGHAAANADQTALKNAVDAIVKPLQQKNAIPGIAIAVTVDGRHYLYNYGVMSKQSQAPVTDRTLFEVGSFSKTVTATLACYAQTTGKLSLTDEASRYLPSLRGSSFDRVSLLNLGTHTSGLPLFVPDAVTDTDQLMAYYRAWRPDRPAGAERIYSNLGIGMLGMITASSMKVSYTNAIEKQLLPALGMTHSYIDVPPNEMKDYAQGYTKADAPVRVTPGVLDAEAYGLKATAPDLLRFIDANLQIAAVDDTWQRAIDCTHTGYYQTAHFVQDLIWEQYPYPVKLDTLLAGNSAEVVYHGGHATALTPPLPPQAQAWLNKTGSTNGFSAYAALVPGKKVGIVILANKSYPIDERVTAAYRILDAFDRTGD